MKKFYEIIIILLSVQALLLSGHAEGIEDIVQVQALGLGELQGISYSPDGATLFSYGGRGIIARDAQTGDIQRIINTDASFINHISISPDGRYIAAGSQDSTITIWDLVTEEKVHVLRGYANPILSVAYSPDGRFLAANSYVNSYQQVVEVIKIWDTQTGDEVQSFGVDSWGGLRFSADGRFLASSSGLWNISTGELLPTFDERGLSVYSPDGHSLATTPLNDGSEITLWDANSGEVVHRLPEQYRVNSLVYSPDGCFLASAADALISLWDVETGEEIHKLNEDSAEGTEVTSLAYSPDGQFIAASLSNQTIRIWHTASGEEAATFSGYTGAVRALAYSPNEEFIAAGSGNVVRVWDATTAEEIHSLVGHRPVVNSVYCVAYSPDGSQIISRASYDDTLVWDATTGEQLMLPKDSSTPALRCLGGIDFTTPLIVHSPDGRFIAEGTPNGIDIVDATTGERVHSLSTDIEIEYFKSEDYNAISYSPDGHYIAASSGDSTLHVWDTRTGDELHTFSGHTSYIHALQYSPDGRYIISASEDKTIRIWHAQTAEVHKILSNHTLGVRSFRISSDGRSLTSWGDDGVVRIWETPDRSVIFPAIHLAQ